jgi:hypothetical protein
MPTLVTPSAALGFSVSNSGDLNFSKDTRAVIISGISNAAHNVNILTTPSYLFPVYYLYDNLYGNSFYGGLPGTDNILFLTSYEGNWILYKYHSSTGLVYLASAPNGSGNFPPNSGWTSLNGTIGTLRVRQVNPPHSSLPTPTVGGVLPSSISNLKVWLKADAGLTTTNVGGRPEVASWADQSGSGLLAYPSVGYGGYGVPVISGALNSKPVVQFESISRHAIVLYNIPSFNISECTTICIHKPNAGDFGNRFSAGRKLYSMGYRNSSNQHVGSTVGARINQALHFTSQKPEIYRDRYVGEIVYFPDEKTSSSPDYSKGAFGFRISTRVNSTSLARTYFYDNGQVSGFTYDAVIAPNSNGYVILGSNGYFSDLDFQSEYLYSGQIAEFIHFNRALTDQELANVTEGLRIKYALY